MKKIFAALAIATTVYSASAENKLHINDFQLAPGTDATVGILLDKDLQIAAIQADVTLEKGLNIVQEGSGYEFHTTDACAETHVVMSRGQSEEGKVRVICYSFPTEAFKGETGSAVLTVKVACEEGVTGKKKINLTNVVAATATGERIQLPDVETEVDTSSGVAIVGVDVDYVYAANGTIYIKAKEDGKITITNAAGVSETVSVQSGMNEYKPAANGVYVVGRQKVIVK